MNQGNQAVRLAAAVLGTKPDNRGNFAAFSGKAQANRFEQLLHASRGVALGEESSGIQVVFRRGIVHDPRQVRHELVVTLKVLRRAMQYSFPTTDIEQMLNEIERGFHG